MKVTVKYILVILINASLFACINDDEGVASPEPPAINRGTIESNRMMVTFYPSNAPTNRTTFEWFDPDGMGGNPPMTNDTIVLQSPLASQFFDYKAEIEFMQDNDSVTADIENLGTKYIVCYRDFNVNNIRRTNEGTNQDVNGKDLGTKTQWITLNGITGSGTMRVTLNFQNARKEGLCDGGIRILEANLNYRIE